MAESLVGKQCQVYGDQVFVKAAGIGSEKPFHQDNFYFGFAEGADVITCWVALDDALEENGCMRMASGSHRRGTLPPQNMIHECTVGAPNSENPIGISYGSGF